LSPSKVGRSAKSFSLLFVASELNTVSFMISVSPD
jgi:hypothetical protein